MSHTRCCCGDGVDPVDPPTCVDVPCFSVSFSGLQPNLEGLFGQVYFNPGSPAPFLGERVELKTAAALNRLVNLGSVGGYEAEGVLVRFEGTTTSPPNVYNSTRFSVAVDVLCLTHAGVDSYRVASVFYYVGDAPVVAQRVFEWVGDFDFDAPYAGLPPVGTVLENQVTATDVPNWGTFGPVAIVGTGTAVVRFTGVCDPAETLVVARRCDNPDTYILVDLSGNTSNLPGVRHPAEGGDLFYLTEETVDTQGVGEEDIAFVDEQCGDDQTRLAYRCSGSGAPFIYSPLDVPPGAVGLRDAGVDYYLSFEISGDPHQTPDEWLFQPCEASVVCPPCSGVGGGVAIEQALIPSGALRARVGSVWYAISPTTTSAAPTAVDEYSLDPCEGDYYEAVRCRNTGLALGYPEKIRYLPGTFGVGVGAVVLLTVIGSCYTVIRYRATTVVDTVGLPNTGVHIGGQACNGGADVRVCDTDPDEAIPINSVCQFCGLPGFEAFDAICARVCLEAALMAPPGGEAKGFKGLVPGVKKAVFERPTYAIPDDFDPQAEARRLRSGGCCGQPSTPGDSPG